MVRVIYFAWFLIKLIGLGTMWGHQQLPLPNVRLAAARCHLAQRLTHNYHLSSVTETDPQVSLVICHKDWPISISHLSLSQRLTTSIVCNLPQRLWPLTHAQVSYVICHKGWPQVSFCHKKLTHKTAAQVSSGAKTGSQVSFVIVTKTDPQARFVKIKTDPQIISDPQVINQELKLSKGGIPAGGLFSDCLWSLSSSWLGRKWGVRLLPDC